MENNISTDDLGKDVHKNTRPLSVSAALIVILLNAIVWLVLGVIILADLHPALPASPLIKGMIGFLSLALAGILLTLFIFLCKHNRIAYFLALALLFVTALLTFFDDFGLSDLVVLIVNVIPIILLIKDRAWYLQRLAE